MIIDKSTYSDIVAESPKLRKIIDGHEWKEDGLSTRNLAAEDKLRSAINFRPIIRGQEKILVLGANGQVAKYLVPELKKYYPGKLILTDARPDQKHHIQALDITDT